jgi:hypothetical protein
MQYHCIVILVNRPLFTAAKNFPTLSAREIFSCRDACRQAANSISRLIRIFDRLYTLRRICVQAVHMIFTASLIHVFNACGKSNSDVSNSAAAQLEICCYALREMGQQFKHATRALNVTIYLKGELLQRLQSSDKRPLSVIEEPQVQEVTVYPKTSCLSMNGDNGIQLSVQETLRQSSFADLSYLNMDVQGHTWMDMEAGSPLDSFPGQTSPRQIYHPIMPGFEAAMTISGLMLMQN